MRIKELDGLRGVAVIAVLDCHYLDWYPVFGASYGWLGVDLFFVLSGFLITGILLELRKERNYFAVFYERRVLRIFPPYFLGLFVYLGISFALGMPGTVKLWAPYVFYYVSLYIHNPLPLNGAPLGVPVAVSFGLTVLWSLSVEEIYYTIWAPIVRFTTEKGFSVILLGMIAAAPFLRWWLHSPHGIEDFAFYCRMDGLACGSAIALLIRRGRQFPEERLRLDKLFDRLGLIVVPASVIFFLAFGGGTGSLLVSTTGITLADLSFALITYSLVRRAGGNQLWVRAFRAKWLRSIGMVSYSLYLFHYPLLIVSRSLVGKLDLSRRVGAVSAVFLGLAMSFAVAYGLWYGMESRILRWKDRKVPSPASAEAAVLSTRI